MKVNSRRKTKWTEWSHAEAPNSQTNFKMSHTNHFINFKTTKKMLFRGQCNKPRPWGWSGQGKHQSSSKTKWKGNFWSGGTSDYIASPCPFFLSSFVFLLFWKFTENLFSILQPCLRVTRICSSLLLCSGWWRGGQGRQDEDGASLLVQGLARLWNSAAHRACSGLPQHCLESEKQRGLSTPCTLQVCQTFGIPYHIVRVLKPPAGRNCRHFRHDLVRVKSSCA